MPWLKDEMYMMMKAYVSVMYILFLYWNSTRSWKRIGMLWRSGQDTAYDVN